MDVAKASLDCAVLTSAGGKPLGRRSFPNSPEGVDRAARWVAQVSGAEEADTHLIVEATAAYHEVVAPACRSGHAGLDRQSGTGAQLRQGPRHSRQDRPDRCPSSGTLRSAGAAKALVTAGQSAVRSSEPGRTSR